MINLKDPTVTSYELDLTEEEKEKNGAVNFSDKNFFLSIYPLIDGEYVKEVPSEVGHFYATVFVGEIWDEDNQTWGTIDEYDLEFKDCREVIPKERHHWGNEGNHSLSVLTQKNGLFQQT